MLGVVPSVVLAFLHSMVMMMVLLFGLGSGNNIECNFLIDFGSIL